MDASQPGPTHEEPQNPTSVNPTEKPQEESRKSVHLNVTAPTSKTDGLDTAEDNDKRKSSSSAPAVNVLDGNKEKTVVTNRKSDSSGISGTSVRNGQFEKPKESYQTSVIYTKEKLKENNEDAEEEETNQGPVFICHDLDPAAAKLIQLKGKSTKGLVNDDADDDQEDTDFVKVPKKAKYYQHAFPEELDYRPAAMAPFATIIKQITSQTYAALNHYGCQRQATDKHKIKVEGTKLEEVREPMDRKLNRLKIYRRAFSSLVIYFRAYSPILFYIKKSYEDMITYRTRQFREAQHEKVKIYYEKVAIKEKMDQYRFPDYNRLQMSQKYLNLLITRIQKQDEAIKFITDILSKMERALSDHYEQARDMEEQIRLIEAELADRREKSMYPRKKFMDIPAEDNKDVTTEIDNVTADRTDPDEDPIDENEEIDEDKRMVLILAYAVCLKDLEEADRKLRIYEVKYQHIAPRHELETVKKKIIEEKAQVKFLQEERDSLEIELIDLKAQEVLVDEELNNLLEMPEMEMKLDAIKQKFAKQKGINKNGVDDEEDFEEMASNSEDDLEEQVKIDEV